MAIVLGDGAFQLGEVGVVGRRHRHPFADGVPADDKSARVDARSAHRSLQLLGVFDGVSLARVGRHLGFSQLGCILDGICQVHLLVVRKTVWYGFFQHVGTLKGQPFHAGYIGNGVLGGHTAIGDDMGAVFLAILVHHPPEHLAAPIVVKIGVNIGQIHAVRVQEALEQQVVFQRVYPRDAQAVGHHGACRGAAPGAHPHAKLVTGGGDEVLHDEEIARETHRLHHVEFKIDMLLDVVRQWVAIVFPRPVIGQLGQIVGLELDAVNLVVATQTVDDLARLVLGQGILAVLVCRELPVQVSLCVFLAPRPLRAKRLGNGEIGHDWAVVNTVHLNLAEHLKRVAQGLGNVGEDVVHLLSCLEPLLLGVHQAERVVQVFACRQAQQVVMGLGGVLVLKVAVVGAHHLDAVFLGKLHERLVGFLLQREHLAVGADGGVFHLVPLQLQIVVVAKHPVIPLASLPGALQVTVEHFGGHLAGNARRANDKPLMVFLEVGSVGARLVIVAVHPRPAHYLDQILVSLVILGQYNKVVSGRVAILLDLVFLVVVGHIHLASENGLERLKPLLDPFFVHDGTIIKKLLDAIHHPMIRDGHAFHAVLDSLVHKIPHLRLAVKHRVMRMYVQMHKIFHVRIKFIGVKLRLNSDMTKRIIQKRLSFK